MEIVAEKSQDDIDKKAYIRPIKRLDGFKVEILAKNIYERMKSNPMSDGYRKRCHASAIEKLPDADLGLEGEISKKMVSPYYYADYALEFLGAVRRIYREIEDKVAANRLYREFRAPLDREIEKLRIAERNERFGMRMN